MTGNFEYKPEFLYLTTTGRKSGLPREIEIWYVAHEGCYYLCAERREQTQWVQNIQQNEAVSFWVNGQIYAGAGRIIDPTAEPELAGAVSRLFDAKYKWSDGLLVELCPVSNPA
jgi:deazaflavin-dependent oxidoreductase (nitroreductase family)